MKRIPVLFLVSVVVLIGAVAYDAGLAEAVVYACSPIAYPNTGSAGPSFVQIYNPNAVTANVTTKWLNRAGTNLVGLAIPGAGPGDVYPGQAGANTVPVPSATTLVVVYQTPAGDSTLSGNVSVVIRVVSDQPVFVAHSYGGGGPHPTTCPEL
jgi:hypothetical protein